MKSKLAADQLQDTVLVLKQRQGASLEQIRKRVEITNSDDDQSKRLSHTLKSLVRRGKVEKQPNGVYKLARGNPAEEDQKEVPSRRRRRGRRRALLQRPCKRHRRYQKLRRSRRGHRHRRRRRRHSRRRRRAFPHGRRKRHRRYRMLRRRTKSAIADDRS